MSKNDQWIVGLTGKNASGKSEVCQYLARKGYRLRSLSDIIRDEARNRSLAPSRENLIILGNELRTNGGPGVLAERTLKELGPGKHVIDSIRTVSEINVLRKNGPFLLLAIDAPIELRFKRAQLRGRLENAPTLKDFQTLENRERGCDPFAQQLDLCFEKADAVVVNDQSLDILAKHIENELKSKGFPLS